MATAPDRRVTSASSGDDISVELSARRTGMSFQRTRMSADRTLMSVIRTSLSLIGFGFTIYQVFEKLLEAQVLRSSAAPRRFGEALLFLGIAMLVLGIGYHIAFMIELRNRREQLKRHGLVHADSGFPASLTLIVAFALLAIGVFAGMSVALHVGPFG
jgi:putative membrane protein